MEREQLDALIEALPEGYEARMEAYLKQIGVEFKVELLGNDCPRYCEQYGQPGAGEFPRKGHIHGKHYLATFRRPADVSKGGTHLKAFTVDFWNSYHDEEFNWLLAHRHDHNVPYWLFNRHGMDPDHRGWSKKQTRTPTPYAVISCLEKDQPDTNFERWARDMGYDHDSRRAEATWKAVMKQWSEVSVFFTADEMEVLREIGQ